MTTRKHPAPPPLEPEESDVTAFHPDPRTDDAASDLAERLGRGYLDGATTKSDDWADELTDEPERDPPEWSAALHVEETEPDAPEVSEDALAKAPDEEDLGAVAAELARASRRAT